MSIDVVQTNMESAHIARGYRTVRELAPSDVLVLRELARAEGNLDSDDYELRANVAKDAAIDLRTNHSLEVEMLKAAACLEVPSYQAVAFDMPALPPIRTTLLGRMVVEALANYFRVVDARADKADD